MHTTLRLSAALLAAAVLVPVVPAVIDAQQKPPAITGEQLLAGLANPSQWLMFGGDYTMRRHSPLTQITPQNVTRLTHQWTFQTGTLGNLEATAIVHDGVLYVTGPNNYAWALDARTGRAFWRYRRELPKRPAGLLRPGQPRLRYPRQPAVHDHARRPPPGARCAQRADPVRRRARRLPARLRLDDRAAGGEEQGDCRRRRRRVRRAWLHRRLRRRIGQTDLAVQHGAGQGRVRQRQLAARRARTRRRWRLGDGQLRPRAEPGLLRHRQPVSRLSRRRSQGRQPVQQLAGGARRRHRPAQVALPVHAARHPRLGLDLTCRSWAT